MPNPLLPTNPQDVVSAKLVKFEFLPIPNLFADFQVNKNTEALLQATLRLWEATGPFIAQGLSCTYDDVLGQWTVAPGRILMHGYDVVFDTPLTYAPQPAKASRVVVRAVETIHRLESDPSVAVSIPGVPTPKPAANFFTYSASLVVVHDGDAPYVPAQNETKVVEQNLLEVDQDGVTVVKQLLALGLSITEKLQLLAQQVAAALSIRHEEAVPSGAKNHTFSTPFSTGTPSWQIYLTGEYDWWEVGFGCETYGVSPSVDGSVVRSPQTVSGRLASGFESADGNELTLEQQAVAVANNQQGFGADGAFGTTAFGLHGTDPAGSGAGWGQAPFGSFQMVLGTAPARTPTKQRKSTLVAARANIVATSNDNSSFKVDLLGADLPRLLVVGSV